MQGRFHKYNKSSKENRTYNGIVFDSKTEMNRYLELLQLERLGTVAKLMCQVEFELQPAFTDFSGKKQRAINYIADFVYVKGGKIIVEDVKSNMTCTLPDYRLKKKMFMFKYPQYQFFENVK
ncbi:MAG: DUF1064 domain-containing protein [bacterium]|nr:DUF1064 domain-containing protein [bacterium]